MVTATEAYRLQMKNLRQITYKCDLLSKLCVRVCVRVCIFPKVIKGCLRLEVQSGRNEKKIITLST